MIFDDPTKHPNSCVEHVRFLDYPLNERFAKLREQEEILQKSIEKAQQKFPDEYAKCMAAITAPDVYGWIKDFFFLEFVEAELMWMAHNVSEDCRDDEYVYGTPSKRKRRREPFISKQIPLFELKKKQARQLQEEEDQQELEFL